MRFSQDFTRNYASLNEFTYLACVEREFRVPSFKHHVIKHVSFVALVAVFLLVCSSIYTSRVLSHCALRCAVSRAHVVKKKRKRRVRTSEPHGRVSSSSRARRPEFYLLASLHGYIHKVSSFEEHPPTRLRIAAGDAAHERDTAFSYRTRVIVDRFGASRRVASRGPRRAPPVPASYSPWE